VEVADLLDFSSVTSFHSDCDCDDSSQSDCDYKSSSQSDSSECEVVSINNSYIIITTTVYSLLYVEKGWCDIHR